MHYQVGGSLTTDAPSYVERQADRLFLAALERGEFCYVLNSRQMGKSSLMVRAHQQCCQLGYRCAVLDMTNIGSENITPLQWYKGIVKDLWRALKITRQADFTFKAWWKDEEDISLSQRLSQFIKDVLLAQFPDDEIVIFLDEIDSILSLPFSVDDFFALVRFCYNQRAIDPAYKRIHFAIFGVATPADLIRDRARTPFNIGTPIYLNGFTQAEAQPLANGLTVKKGEAEAVLKAILTWTDGQPFLTQKLCQLAISSSQDAANQPLTIPPGNEAYWVENLVQKRIIDRWESQDEPEHLRTIRNRILNNPEAAGRLLSLYQQVLEGEVAADDSREQIELVLSGLVTRSKGLLQVKNRIYGEIFNLSWIKHQLNQLRPYAQQFETWVASQKTDESRLLRGQALKDAQVWAQGKRLSDLDYQYLAASVEGDRKAIQQGLEAQRVKAVEAQLAEEQARLIQEQKTRIQEKKTLRFQRLLSAAIGGALLVTAGLGLTALRQARNAKIHEVEALVSAADGSFDSHRQLDAIVQALRAHKNLAGLTHLEPELAQAVKATLQRVMLGANELNRLTFSSEVNDSVFSPDGQLIAIATAEGILSLRQNSGEVIWEIPAHEASIGAVAFSPDGQTIATGAADKNVKLWTLEGELISTPVSQFDSVRELSFFPDGKSFVAAGRELTGRWGIDGEQIMFTERGVLQAIATDGSMLVFHLRPTDLQDSVRNRPPPPRRLNRLDNRQASGENARFDTRANVTAENTQPSQQREVFRSETSSRGHLINTLVTNAQGERMAAFVGETGPTFSTAISAANKLIATSGRDGAVHIWEPDGTFVQVLVGNRSDVREIAFSPDGELIATTGDDNVIRLWQVKGGLIKTFEGHRAEVNKLIFNPDGRQLMSTSEDQTLRLWQVKETQYQSLAGHGDAIEHLAFNNDAQLFSSSIDLWLNVWQQQGDHTQAVPTQQIRPKEHPRVSGMATYNQELALALPDGHIKIWQAENWASPDRLPADYPASQILDVGTSAAGLAYSPDGQQLVVITSNSTIKLLQRDPTGQFSAEPTALVESIRQPEAIAFSPDDTPDGTLIAVGSGEGTLTLLNAEGNLLKTIEGHAAAIVDTVFSPDGQWLAAASEDRRLELWSVSDLLSESFDAKSFNPRADSLFATEQTQISQITFTPNSQLLVSALADGTLSIWDLSSQERLRTLWGHDSALNTVAVSPDGKLIASAGRDRKIILWNLPAILAQDEVTAACEWVRNYLKHGSQAADYQALCSKSTHSP